MQETLPIEFRKLGLLSRLLAMIVLLGCFLSFPAQAGTNIPLTINLSEPVDVGGVTRYATKLP